MKDIIGVYTDENKIVDAVKQFNEQGIAVKDAYTPYPVFEIIEAMGLKTRFPYFAFAFGVIGVSLTFLFLYYTSVLSYPLVIGGKPYLSLTFVVIMFVATILVTVISSLIAFFVRENKGPGQVAELYHPEITDDKFVLVVNTTNKMTDEDVVTITNVMQNTGAIEIEEKEIENENQHDTHSGSGTHAQSEVIVEQADVSETIIDCAEKVHQKLGTLQSESSYCDAMASEISKKGLSVKKGATLPVVDDNFHIENVFYITIGVNKNLLVAIKLVDQFTEEHTEQTLKHMQLAKCETGFLINFNKESLSEGLKKLTL